MLIGASIVLLIVFILVMRELGGNRTDASPKTKRSAKRPIAPAPVEEVEVTRVGRDPKTPRLPNFHEDEEPDINLGMTGQSALTAFESGAVEGVDEPTGPVELILISAVAQTDVGQKRKRNEDSYLVMPEQAVYVVADGMGGYAGGDVASRIAVNTIAQVMEAGTFVGKADPKRPIRGNELVWAIEAANTAVHDAAQASPELEGMGTTLVSCRFSAKRQRVFIGHVGDSRCYRFRGSKLVQLTTDHTLAQKGVTGPYAANLSRAVGISKAAKVDLIVDAPRPKDVYVLCSDGLSKMLTDAQIEEALVAAPNPDECVQHLISAANSHGGRDNITVILIKVGQPNLQGVS